MQFESSEPAVEGFEGKSQRATLLRKISSYKRQEVFRCIYCEQLRWTWRGAVSGDDSVRQSGTSKSDMVDICHLYGASLQDEFARTVPSTPSHTKPRRNGIAPVCLIALAR